MLAAFSTLVQQNLQPLLVSVAFLVDLPDVMLPHFQPMRHVAVHQHLQATGRSSMMCTA